MGRGFFPGLMAQHMKVSSARMRLRAKESIDGSIKGPTQETGSTTRCTERAYFHGLTALSMKEITSWIRKRGQGLSHGKSFRVQDRMNFNMLGRLARNTLASGKMASKMARGYSSMRVGTKSVAYGKTAKILNGSIKDQLFH